MLTTDILNSLKTYTSSMKKTINLVLQTGEHAKRAELKAFLTSFSSVSDKISIEVRDQSSDLRSPISFLIEADGDDTGIRFSGIPSGHEFNSFVLAVLNASGTPLKIDESIQKIVKSIDASLNFEVFVSLSCHNCPELVQALNQFALINPNIKTEMIDGGLYKELIETRNIQGVPSVYLNGEVFANGKIDQATLLEKLIEIHPIHAVRDEPVLPVQDVTIIGGGPAGVAAAIYSARKGLKVTMIADRIGGQVKDTMGIENLISVPKTTGPELSQALQTHMDEYDITLRAHLRVSHVEKGKVKRIHLSSGEIIDTKTMIIATGAKWRELGVPGEKENIGKGVAYCPHCDGPFFKGKDVAVVGGGNSGIEAALDLSGIVNTVTVFEFMPELKADKVLVKQAESKENITLITNAISKQVLAEHDKVYAIEYQDRESGEIHQKNVSGIFVQIGLVPNSHFVKDIVELSEHGEIKIDERGRTSEPGIFACGDVTTVPYKQIVIAMGEGAKTSLAAFDYLLLNH